MDLDAYLRRVGRNVRRARWAAGLTLEQVAGRGISFRHLQELETGKRNASLEVMLRLARILNTTPGYFVDVNPAATGKARLRIEAANPKPPKTGRKPIAR